MSLQIEIVHQDQVLIVRLKGELDHHNAEKVKTQIHEALDQTDCEHIILSLQKLVFMDSSGIGVILGRYKYITGKGGKMVVCDVSTSLYRLFELSGMFKILTIQDNEELALSSLGVKS